MNDYIISQTLFLRLIGVNFLFAFWSLKSQVLGLYGKNGIQPMNLIFNGLDRKNMINIPSLFWFSQTDFFMQLVIYCGIFSSGAIILGNTDFWYYAISYIAYISFVIVGSPFLNYQWDAMLLETAFMCVFYSMTNPPNVFMHYAIWIFFVRFMVSAGLAKIKSGDKNWRELKSMNYHYWTQPLPNKIAWHIDKMSEDFHKASCAIALAIQVCLSPLLLSPLFIRKWIVLAQLFLQIMIALTGNYCFFNTMAVTFLVPFIPDSYWSSIFIDYKININIHFILLIAACFIVYNNATMFLKQFFSNLITQDIAKVTQFHSKYQPFVISNPYGLFANMTTDRKEIIIEGSYDGENWKTYEFKYKPGDTKQYPIQVAPHQPRIDWQMWFASLSDFQSNPWFLNLMIRLVKNEKDVTSLIKYNPFENKPPAYLRAMFYQYTFTTKKEFQNTKNYWNRKLIGKYSPVIEIK